MILASSDQNESIRVDSASDRKSSNTLQSSEAYEIFRSRLRRETQNSFKTSQSHVSQTSDLSDRELELQRQDMAKYFSLKNSGLL